MNGITITKRWANENDARDGVEEHLNRDLSHLTSNPKFLDSLYAYRLSDEEKEKVHTLFRDTFMGTKSYHNYTKDMKPGQTASQRFMMDLTANEYMYVNKETFDVTSSDDAKAIEFVKFYLKGQSFLYNQIRKMIGSIIQVIHGDLDAEHQMKNSFSANGCLVALSPGDGLMLEKVAYDKYNEFNTHKKNDIMI